MQPSNRTWDPGGVQDQEKRNKLFKINIPVKIYSLIMSAVDMNDESDNEDVADESSRTELDSHANMPVVGSQAYIISDTGRMADVNPFTPDYESMLIPIVDAAVRYECPYDGKTYILVVRNALHVPSMRNNLIPPFIMREAGIRVSDTPKIQVIEPTEDDHSIYFPDTDFRIPLSLYPFGVCSLTSARQSRQRNK
jgi:hypothetical protein